MDAAVTRGCTSARPSLHTAALCSSRSLVSLQLRLGRSAGCAAHRSQRRRAVSLTPRAILNPEEDPILKEAFKEPVAFFGGLVAGLLRLDLQEEPLRDWVQRTSKAAGVDEPTSSAGISDGEIQLDDDDDAATEIDIE